ncbi:nuclear pore complex protein Nup93 [Pseudoscourfieldia marina]
MDMSSSGGGAGGVSSWRLLEQRSASLIPFMDQSSYGASGPSQGATPPTQAAASAAGGGFAHHHHPAAFSSAASASSGALPRIQLGLDELLQQSQKLKARTPRFDVPMETEQGTMMLAREGFDAHALMRDVMDFEERARYVGGTGTPGGTGARAEDAASTTPSSSVDNYMRQIHESAVMSAVRSTMRSASVELDAFRDSRRHAEWRHSRVEGAAALGAGFGGAHGAGPSTPGGIAAATSPGTAQHQRARFAAQTPLAANPMAQTPVGTLAPRVRAYAAAVRSVLQAHAVAPTRECALVDMLATAAAPGTSREEIAATDAAVLEGGDAQGAAVAAEEVWLLLKAMVSRAGLSQGARIHGASSDDVALALVRGARDYLEQQHDSYMTKVLSDQPDLARLGGAPGARPRVEAYLRVRGGGATTTDTDDAWPILFYLVRSGHYAAARDAAPTLLRDHAGVGESATGASATLNALLAWFNAEANAAKTGGVPAVTDEALRRAAADEARTAHRQGKGSTRPYRLALMAACTRDLDLEVKLGRYYEKFHESIQDYLWLKLCLVQTLRASSGGSGAALTLASPSQAPSPGFTPGGIATGAGGASGAYSVEELRASMNRYPASRYSQNGRAPHQCAVVYLCTLQPYAAAKHLWDASASTPAPPADVAGAAHDAAPPPTTPFAVACDGAHLALALCHHGVMAAAGEPGASQAGMSPGAFARQVSSLLLRRYAMAMMRVDVSAAADAAAAACRVCFPEGGVNAMAEAIIEGLKTCADRDAVIGDASRGRELYIHATGVRGEEIVDDGSAVSRLAPRVEARRELLHRAGKLSELRGDYDAACELFVRCGAPHEALGIMNRRLSDSFHGAGDADGALRQQCQSARELCEDYTRAHYGAAAGTREGDIRRACEVETDALKQLIELQTASLRAAGAGGNLGGVGAASRVAEEVLERLRRLPWLPFELHRVDHCAREDLAAMHPAVRARLPDALLLAANALREVIAAGHKSRRVDLEAIAQYAGRVPHLPGHVVKRCSDLCSGCT